MNDKTFIEELKTRREEYRITQKRFAVPMVSVVNTITALKTHRQMQAKN